MTDIHIPTATGPTWVQNDIDLLALRTAQEIEDLFCRGWPGGRAQRNAAVQTKIAKAMIIFWEGRIARLSEGAALEDTKP